MEGAAPRWAKPELVLYRVHQLQTDEKGEIYPKLSSEMNEFVIMVLGEK